MSRVNLRVHVEVVEWTKVTLARKDPGHSFADNLCKQFGPSPGPTELRMSIISTGPKYRQ